MNKKASGIKINDPAPKTPFAPTPPKGPRSKFTMHRFNRYPQQESFFMRWIRRLNEITPRCSRLTWRLPYNSLPMLLNSDSLFSTQKLIKHSRSKDQYLRVALKRLIETQLLEDELKEVNESNKILLARNQELETQLVKESRERAGKWLISSRYIQSCPNDVLD
jgi:hypothetical protein